jgi:hypothetical protein
MKKGRGSVYGEPTGLPTVTSRTQSIPLVILSTGRDTKAKLLVVPIVVTRRKN